ncbi:efflux RND transporter periplasmic adaptor subunit [Halobacillus salinus]|uniref:Efflux RND transporter periplasmic adaptor subunit n=1 Tax=Halobacillus salinus TaxID=192814 RepID=A0A4Z0GWV3_9BACI|nr:efflux RND transporter periplasmic adaptor subunit [Halobacillus salinus]TGB01853.1 efflux RND transporter periplasmic adaptor subunit [Halobacillus salinus]
MKTKNYAGRIIGLLIIALVATNSFLIFFDEEGRVEQKSYVEEWSKSTTYNLFERLNVNGVFASDDENEVYFDESIGSFQTFQVEEGQVVQEGDDLYTYQVTDYGTQEAELEGEIDRLEEEIDAIEDYVDELEDYDIPEPESDDDSSDPPSYVETEYLQEADIAEQDAELEKKRAMLDMVQDQLDQLQDDGEEITVTSPYNGTVTDVSKDLQAPLLTLKASSLIVTGELNEEERQQVEQDMPSQVTVEDIELETSGTLTSIHDFPEQVEVQRSSRYPFEVTLEGEAENVLPGYHADVEIITDSAINAVTVLDNVLLTDEDLYAWVMNEQGVLERRAVETGIEEQGLIEVEEGLAEGEWLAAEPKDEFRHQAPFLTPIHLRDLSVKRLLDSELGDWKTYGLFGILSR